MEPSVFKMKEDMPDNLEVAFIEKGLMCLSFPQTEEQNYFPELEF